MEWSSRTQPPPPFHQAGSLWWLCYCSQPSLPSGHRAQLSALRTKQGAHRWTEVVSKAKKKKNVSKTNFNLKVWGRAWDPWGISTIEKKQRGHYCDVHNRVHILWQLIKQITSALPPESPAAPFAFFFAPSLPPSAPPCPEIRLTDWEKCTPKQL